MSAKLKLLIIVVFVALVPLSVSAWMAFRIHKEALEAKVTQLQNETAKHGASTAQATLDQAARHLTLLANKTIQWNALSPNERTGALWLVYRQHEDAVVVSLLDESGKGIGPGAYLDESATAAERGGHRVASMRLLEDFSRSIPFGEAKSRRLAFGRPFRLDDGKGPILPLAISVPGSLPSSRWVVAVALSLESLCQALNDVGGSNSAVLLADAQGKVICSPKGKDASVLDGGVLKRAAERSEGLTRHVGADGREIMVAGTKVPIGWIVAVTQPAEQAFAASTRIRSQTIFWLVLSFFIALAAGLLLSGSISRPLRRLVGGARELAQGNMAHRVKLGDRDEFGELADALDHMAEQVERRDAEIRAWNEELRQRVADRTRELEETHTQLVRSQKLAAMMTLASGVAHEINNPLTGVLGITQVLLERARKNASKAGDAKLLESAEKEALRIKGIVRRMLSLVQEQPRLSFTALQVNGLLDSTLRVLEKETTQSQVEIVRDYDDSLVPIPGAFAQLQQAMLQVLTNALTAVGEGGRITLRTAVVNEFVRIAVEDNGSGIPPERLEKIFEPFFTSKDDWEGQGLGLSIAFRIVENHRGSIKVDSVLGEGTTVTILLPLTAQPPHLD